MKKLMLMIVAAFMNVLFMKAAPTSSLTFNGTDQYVQIPNSADFKMAAGENLSFSMWVKPSAWTNAARFIGYRIGDDTQTGYEAYILSSGYACTATGITGTGSTGRPIDTVISSGDASNQWTHIVVVFDRANQKSVAYVNGVLKEEDTLTSEMVFASTRDILIGAGWYGENSGSVEVTRFYAGDIANVRFYRGALTQAQAQADMNANSYDALSGELKSMCVAAYDLTNDFTSLSVTDLSGRGNHGELKGYTAPVFSGMIAGVTVTQNTDYTGRSNEYEPILFANVQVSSGSAVLQSVEINLDGSTAVTDYSKVKIYKTIETVFDDRNAQNATLLGEFVPQAGNMTCQLTTKPTLTSGNNYIWVVAEVAADAVEGNKLDAALLKLTTSNEAYSVTGGDPSGNREILLARKKLYAPGDNGSTAYRIPAMVILPDGKIVTAIDRRWNNESDLPNDIDIIARISEDGGYTWSQEYPIAEALDSNNGRGDCALVVTKEGDIVAAFVGGNGLWASSESDPISSFISRSTDGGRTWSAVAENGAGDITSKIWGSKCNGDDTRLNATAAFFGSGRGLCLTRQTGSNASKNGRIMFVTAINRGGTLYNYAVYSDDSGVTWNVSEQAYSAGDEAKVTELNDGTILMSVRRSNGNRGYAKSTDGGETWFGQSSWDELSVNACNGDIMEYTAVADGYDKNRTLQSLPINDGNKRREKICVYLSYDEGATWTRKKQMFPDLAAYSTMIKFPDGTIGMYAEDQQNNVTTTYFMRFSLSWLTDGQDVYTAPGSTEKAEAPVFNPGSGQTYEPDSDATIQITSSTPDAQIYYTTDGSNPEAGVSNVIQNGGTITLNTASPYGSTITVKAVAVADGMKNSDMVSATYTVKAMYTKIEGTASTNMEKYESNPVENVTDGNYTTIFWKNGAQASGDYILLTLDAIYNIGDINIFFSDADKPTGTAKIQISTDNSQWTDIASFTSQNIGGSETNYLFSCNANAAQAQYVRLYIESANGNTWLKVSEFHVYDYFVQTADPVITLSSGSNIEKGVTLIPVSCATDGAVIYYTTDGSEPTERSAQAVNGNIIVDASNSDYETTITVKAAAKADGYNISNVVTATYTVKDPYGMFCTPAATTTGNKRAQTKGEILNATGVIEGSTLTFTPSGSRSNQAWSNSDDKIKVEPGATFNLKVTYGLDGWDDLSVYQMKSSSDYTLIYGTYAGAWTQGGSTATLFNNINAAADGATADATAGTATFPITIPEDMNNGDLLVIRFIIHSSVFNNNPCATGISELNYCDYVFSIVKNMDITTDETETDDAEYGIVTLSLDETTQSEPVWGVGTHHTEAHEMVIDVEADGATPEISIDGNGSISAQTIKVVRKITSDQWTLMSMPFTFNLSEVQVNGVAANYNDNIRIKEYDAALRANNSVDGYTASGWVEKTSGTISANEGFAIVVNPANGAEQTVTFTTTGFTMDANDKQITFTEQPSNANVINGKSMDSDWNLKGNPMLQSAEKGQGYTLYVHEAGTNTYRELSSTDRHTYSPFVAWFVQCDNDGGFMNLTFSHNGTSTYGSSMEDNITGRFDIVINGGEDEARLTVLEGSSEMYERNEDAMYFAPLNDKISQLYLIDKEGAKIASSVVPAPYDEVKLAYKAAVAGAQTLTVTSVIPGTAVYLVDNEEGTETLMNEGSEYSFTSEAGLNSERFAVKTIIDVTGIEESTAETSSVSAVVAGDAVKIYGATAGETIDVYTVNGVMVSSAVAVEGENEISVPAQGVLIVKVGDEVVKIVK